jgi:hypothetical protein
MVARWLADDAAEGELVGVADLIVDGRAAVFGDA